VYKARDRLRVLSGDARQEAASTFPSSGGQDRRTWGPLSVRLMVTFSLDTHEGRDLSGIAAGGDGISVGPS
jgi:hypothetical protein